MRETRIRSLIGEHPTCLGATNPGHSYWACALEPRSHNCWAHMLQLLKPGCPWARAPQRETPLQWEDCMLQLERSPCSNEDPAQPNINKWISVLKNLPSSAGSRDSVPGLGSKIPHAERQLSPRAATSETMCSGVHELQLERSKPLQQRTRVPQPRPEQPKR